MAEGVQGYLVVTVVEASGKSRDDTYVWDDATKEGYVKGASIPRAWSLGRDKRGPFRAGARARKERKRAIKPTARPKVAKTPSCLGVRALARRREATPMHSASSVTLRAATEHAGTHAGRAWKQPLFRVGIAPARAISLVRARPCRFRPVNAVLVSIGRPILRPFASDLA